MNETAPIGPKTGCPQRSSVQDDSVCGIYRCAGRGCREGAAPQHNPCLQAGRLPPGRTDMKNSFARKVLLGAAITASMGIGYAIGAQPHMEASIGLLQNARAELAAASPNKGGHRERALGMIDQAIGEVRAGIAFAATH